MKLTKEPKIDIRWGLQTEENRIEWINWVAENLATISKNATMNELRNIALQLFDKINFCGYEEGFDAALRNK